MLDLAWRFGNDGKADGHTGPVTAVSGEFSLDQRDHFATGGQDGTIRIWDLESGHSQAVAPVEHAGVVSGVAVAHLASGYLAPHPVLVSAGHDGVIRVWDLATMRPYGDPLTGHQDAVTALDAGWRGRHLLLLSGSRDRTVRLWDLHDRKPQGRSLLAPELKTPTITLPTGPIDAVVLDDPYFICAQPVMTAGRFKLAPKQDRVAGRDPDTIGARVLSRGNFDGRPVLAGGSQWGGVEVRQLWRPGGAAQPVLDDSGARAKFDAGSPVNALSVVFSRTENRHQVLVATDAGLTCLNLKWRFDQLR